MDAILLVGGFGTRLLPLTKTLPKPLIPLANVPFVERTITWLHDAGVDHVVLSLHYNAEQFQDYFRRRVLGVDISFAIEDSPLGTGGAIKNCEPHLRSERCFIFNGDIFTDLRLRSMLRAHQAQGAQVSIAMKEVDDPSRYGVIETDDQGRILSFTEKPPRELAPSRDVNAGVYIFEREMFDAFPAGPCSVERDYFPTILCQGAHLLGYRQPMYWTDLGTPADYLQAHRDILEGHVDVPWPYREVAPGIWVGRGVSIDMHARITPPVVLDDGVRVYADATVGPSVVLGRGVQVSEKARVEDSVVWEGATIRTGSLVRGSILGRFTTICGALVDGVCEDHQYLPAEESAAA